MPSDPIISHSSRDFSEVLVVTLLWDGTWNGRGKFLYTLDGNTPTLASTVVAGPSENVTIPAGATVTLKVIAYDESDATYSSEVSETYTWVNPNVAPAFDVLQSASFNDIRTGFEAQLTHIANDDGLPTGVLSYSVTAGAVPTGMTLDSNTGILSGIPTVDGLYNYTLEVTDGDQTDSKAFSVQVNSSGLLCPLGAPYDTVTSESLEALTNLDYQLIKKTSETKGTVRVSWNKLGLADTENTILHELYVKEASVLMPGFPVILENEEAFTSKYSALVTGWDLTKEHTIQLIVNCDFSKTITVPASNLKATEKKSLAGPLDLNNTGMTLTNMSDGIKVSLNSCAGDIKRIFKNVTIKKKDGALAPAEVLDAKFMRSVEVPLTIGSTPGEYSFINHNGSKKTSFTTPEFEEIFNDRREILVGIEVDDTSENYLEVVNTSVIDNTDSANIVELLKETYLDKAKHNDGSVLYHALDTGKYWKYRDWPISVPFQATITEPSIVLEWLPFMLLDSDYDNSISVPVPGFRTNSGASATVKAAVKNSKGDFTAFSTTVFYQTDLAIKLDTDFPGVTFMDEPCCHVDTDVTAGEWYTYEIEVETWYGTKKVVGRQVIKREEVAVASVSDNISLESLQAPAKNPDEFLSEADFQSGRGRNMSSFLSGSDDDIALFTIMEEVAKKGAGCGTGDCK